MATPINDALKEAETASKFIRGVGPITSLSIAVLVLCVALGFTLLTARAGADRWTRTDHDKYAQQESQATKQMSREITETHEDVAVLKATVSRMESDLQIIKSAVIKIERKGSN